MKKKKIYFTYPDCVSFSGQTKASEMIKELCSLKESHFIFFDNIFPAYNRKKKGALIIYLYELILFYTRHLLLKFKKPDLIYLNLGQSLSKFLMHALPITLFFSSKKIIISLHGNNFLDWEDNIELKLFKFILKKTKLVTILGENQKDGLYKIGIKNVQVVPNCIDVKPIDESEIFNKQNNNFVSILHLSLLIESKGFPIILNSLQKIKNKDIGFVLCGPVAFTSYCKDFKSIEQKNIWIENKISSLNSSSIKSEWIRGAKGDRKRNLFANASIFIFPSTFPVESQPLVLLEAASMGCAIITSRIGEIEEMFNENEVLFLNNVTESEIIEKVNMLLDNKELRLELGINAYRKFMNKYSTEKYLFNWSQIFKNI